MSLDDRQVELYSRQIILRELGGAAQRRLLDARCLAIGGGPALESALSYLAGAGLGAIDVVARPGAGGDALGLAPLGERSPDVRVRALAAPDTSLDEYDVFLVCAKRDAGTEVPTDVPGLPRHGSVVVESADDGSVVLVLVPRDSGCAACVRSATSGSAVAAPGDAPPIAAGALALAGAMAALAACRWIAGIDAPAAGPPPWRGPGDDARALRLSPGTPCWEESAVARASRCPRGCPPPDRAL